MLLISTSLLVVTDVSLPLRTLEYTSSNGSLLCRTEMTSGVSLTTEVPFLLAYSFKNFENSDSVASEGWTETIESEER